MLTPGHYTTLPENFFARLSPRPVRKAELIRLNKPLASDLGLESDWLSSDAGIAFLTTGARPDGLGPVAMAYAGHQFGHFVPSLGDGRAMLIGEARDHEGILRDIHLKGSGPTPFSRRGDGRAALGPVLREYVISEAMHALNIPTTRALAALTTGETVMRETPMPGGIIARVAQSHVRVGTFQYFAAQGDQDAVRILADHVIERLYPELSGAQNSYLALLEAIITRQAELVAKWMLVGFVHGVMNTDNMAISGETIDFGPCAFLDEYDPGKVFSFIDENGRYAYGKQPDMALWNLGRLAESLLPLLDQDREQAIALARTALMSFDDSFGTAYLDGWRRKLGFFTSEEQDAPLIGRLLTAMHHNGSDFTLTFRSLSDITCADDDTPFVELFSDADDIRSWLKDWQERTGREQQTDSERRNAMHAANPRIIPRNHQVEAVIQAALKGDFNPFHMLVEALADPFSNRDDGLDTPPSRQERIQNTFCGT